MCLMNVLFPLVFHIVFCSEDHRCTLIPRTKFRFSAHTYIKQKHISTREPDKEGEIFRRYFLPGDSRVSQLRVARIFLLLKLRDSVL